MSLTSKKKFQWPFDCCGIGCGGWQHHTAADVGDVARHQALTEVDDGPEVLIECRDVYKAFGEKQILKGASFKVRLLLMPVVVNAGPAKGPIQSQSWWI
jgi:hypothetical protein